MRSSLRQLPSSAGRAGVRWGQQPSSEHSAGVLSPSADPPWGRGDTTSGPDSLTEKGTVKKGLGNEVENCMTSQAKPSMPHLGSARGTGPGEQEHRGAAGGKRHLGQVVMVEIPKRLTSGTLLHETADSLQPEAASGSGGS